VILAELAIVLAIPLAGAAVGPAWIIATQALTAAGLVAYKTVRLDRLSASEGLDTRPMSAAPHHAVHEDAQGAQGRQGGTPGPAEGEIPSAT
jgi:hypothetical protein